MLRLARYITPDHRVHSSFKKKIAFAFALVLLVLGIIFFAFRKINEKTFDTARLVEHTHEVLFNAERVNTGINEMQSAIRGFVISGEENYFDFFNRTARKVDSIINKLKLLTLDNPGQQSRIDTLEKNIAGYIASRQGLVSARRNKGFDEAQKIFADEKGKLLIGQMHSTIRNIVQAENGLLAARKNENGKSVQNSSWITLLLLVIIILLLGLALLIIYSNTRARDKAEIALRNSEQFIKAIINNTSNPITIRDISGKYLLINMPVTKLFNLPEKEILGKNAYDFLPKETADQAKEADDECIAARSTTQTEIALPRKDGTHYFSVNRFPLFDEKDNVMAVGTVSTDITKIKKAEEQIRQLNMDLEKRVEEKTKEVIEKEQQYRFLLKNMREGIQIVNRDWQYIFVNTSVVKQSKLSDAELIGYTMMEKYPGIENTEVFKRMKRCMDERTPELIENEFTFPDGTKEWYELSIQPVADGILILSMDITERKNVENKLYASESRFRSIIEQFPYPVVTYTPDGSYTNANKAWETMWHYKREDVVGYNIRKDPQMVSSGLSVYVEKAFAGEVAISEPYLYDPELIGYKSPKRWMQMTLYPLKNDNGRILEVILILLDMTEIKEAEEKLRRYAEELQSSNVELERFAYVASHDLQEPLRMVGSFLNLLEEEYGRKLDKTAKEYIDFAVDGARRMKILVNDLLQYSRVGTNKEEFIPTDLNDIMEYVLRVFDEEIKKSRASVTVKTLPVIRANKTLIGQLFINLIGNALKYCGDAMPEIEIGFTQEKDGYLFYIKDNGIGIDPKFFDKIFIIFQRLHSKAEYSGTGIGLAICKKIVDLHKGKIWVESKPGQGSIFYFSIPANDNGARGFIGQQSFLKTV